ncbi:MAG: TIGR03000 domain-containing protein [Planctomycetes bacterium]|nr:TIGR03000 domain-containing protein [Planctomycetota bacterium]
MYSIVMLAAMSAGADVTPPPAPAPHVVAAPVVAGCCGGVIVSGCYGCSGSCYGCYGSCYGSCHGGIFHRGGFLGHKHSCHGCCGGYSCSGYNCFASGWSCSGCTGCSGFAGYVGACHGCYGISYGSSWGPPVGMLPYTLHGYNSGVAPVYGPSFPVVLGNLTDPKAVYGNVYHPNQPPVMTVPVEPMKKPAGSDDKPMGANLKFTVPADTKLYVDGKLAPGSGTERVFYTPPLEAGKKFFYEVKAELVVDGKTVADEKKVIVEAGANITESFAKLTAAVEKANSVAGK